MTSRLPPRSPTRAARCPTFSALTLHVGASDLGAQVPGLTLGHLDVAAAAADQPVKADAAGKLGDQPIALAATTGPLTSLLPNAKPRRSRSTQRCRPMVQR